MDLVRYIREQLAAGQDIQIIVSLLEQSGFKSEQINAAFREALSSTEVGSTAASTARPVTESAAPESAPPSSPAPTALLNIKNIDFIKALEIIGLVLILTAILIVISSQWNKISPLGKIALVAVPNLMLFLISFLLRGKESYKSTHDATLITGLIIFPFSIGTFLFQSQIIDKIGFFLVAVSTASSLVLYLIIEFLLKKEFGSAFTNVAGYIALLSFLGDSEADTQTVAWVMTLCSLFMLAIGTLLAASKQKNNESYITLNGATFPFFLYFTIQTFLHENLKLEGDILFITSSFFGLFMLIYASILSNLWKRFDNNTFYSVKRFIEEIAGMFIIGPYIWLQLSEDIYSLLAMILGVVLVITYTKIPILSFLGMGFFGIIAGIIDLSIKIFADSVAWPITLFIIGFAIIGISILARKLYKAHKLNYNQELFFGLGEDPRFKKLK